MKVPVKYIFSVIVSISFICPGYAQQSMTISGHVMNKATRTPLQMVNVYLDRTSLGSATNKDGNFTIRDIPAGTYTLVVSMIGYKKIEVEVPMTGDVTFNFALVEEPIRGREVTIVGEFPKEWKRNLERFERAFLGRSEFASDCSIENPEVLDFEFTEQSIQSDRPDAAKRGVFKATACRPLIIINNALGYKLVYQLKVFEVTMTNGEFCYIDENGPVFWGQSHIQGLCRFYQLPPKNMKELKNWRANREKAYNGSLRHFFYSLAHNCVKKEGFKILSFSAKRNIPASAITKYDSLSDNYMLRFADLNRIEDESIFDKIRVWYTKEKDYIQIEINRIQSQGKDYTDMALQKRYQSVIYQKSQLCLKPGSEVVFNKHGIVVRNISDFTFTGYWHHATGAAEWLPLDYTYTH